MALTEQVSCRLIDLDDERWPWDEWDSHLSSAERRRAEQFRFERDRRWFVRRRAWRTQVLSDFFGDAVTLSFGPHGQPLIDQGRWSLSCSHSRGLAAIALAPCAVGVDIERSADAPVDRHLIPTICSADEAAQLYALPADQLHAALLRVWTRKEALLKAIGTGIGATPLTDIHVGCAEQPSPLRWPHGGQWCLYEPEHSLVQICLALAGISDPFAALEDQISS